MSVVITCKDIDGVCDNSLIVSKGVAERISQIDPDKEQTIPFGNGKNQITVNDDGTTTITTCTAGSIGTGHWSVKTSVLIKLIQAALDE